MSPLDWGVEAPWGPAAATSIGSLPGTSSQEAARVVTGELAEFVHVPELPGRGPGADMVGRTGGLLASVSAGLSMETTPAGWRFAMAPGRQTRLAQAYLREDLDALEENATNYAGPVKVQVVGPWTMAAAVELRTGERALRDPQAVWDIAQALGAALVDHVADVRRRLPKASVVVVQLDEPSLAAVREGRIGTASGLSSYRAVDDQDASRVLGEVLDAARSSDVLPGIHCCAFDVPVDLIRMSGASFVSLDFVPLLTERVLDDQIGRAFDAGLGIMAGTVPSIGSGDLGDARASAPLRAVLHRLGLESEQWIRQVSVTPSCGLAGASPSWVRTALASCQAVGRVVRDDQEEEQEERGD